MPSLAEHKSQVLVHVRFIHFISSHLIVIESRDSHPWKFAFPYSVAQHDKARYSFPKHWRDVAARKYFAVHVCCLFTYYIADQICAKIYAAEIVSQRDLRREVRRHDLHQEIR